MTKKLSGKMVVEVGAVSLGKKDTAKLSLSFKHEDAGVDPNAAVALLARGSLKCRLDRGNPKQQTLQLEATAMPVTTITLDGTCHRIGSDGLTCSFGLSFPKSEAPANDLGDFAGQTAKLTVVRTGDIADIVTEEHGEEIDDQE
jgi:hypothetical protein